MVASVPVETRRMRSTAADAAHHECGELALVGRRRAEGQPAVDRRVHGVLDDAGCAWPRSAGPHEQTRST